MATLSSRDILARGSILGAMLALPSVGIFLVLWYVTDDVMIPAIVGAAVHFVAMGFSLKFAKKFLIKRDGQ